MHGRQIRPRRPGPGRDAATRHGGLQPRVRAGQQRRQPYLFRLALPLHIGHRFGHGVYVRFSVLLADFEFFNADLHASHVTVD
eukprot:scaffold118054_cov22-Prasinocladus_malaysianus.AAC.1